MLVLLSVHGCFFTHLQLLGKITASSCKNQWLLIVELHQFHNLYNAIMVSGEGFCCCEYTEPDVQCNEEAAESLPDCEPCDTWLSASVSHCTEPSPCSFSTLGHSDPSPTSTYNLTEKFVFVLSAGVSPDEVRVTKNLCNHH